MTHGKHKHPLLTSPLVLVVPEVIMVGPKAVSFDDQITNKKQLTNE